MAKGKTSISTLLMVAGGLATVAAAAPSVAQCAGRRSAPAAQTCAAKKCSAKGCAAKGGCAAKTCGAAKGCGAKKCAPQS